MGLGEFVAQNPSGVAFHQRQEAGLITVTRHESQGQKLKDGRRDADGQENTAWPKLPHASHGALPRVTEGTGDLETCLQLSLSLLIIFPKRKEPRATKAMAKEAGGGWGEGDKRAAHLCSTPRRGKITHCELGAAFEKP